jgi:hypothetical protein
MPKNKVKNYFPTLIILANIILAVFLGWLIIQVNQQSNQNALVKNQLADLTTQKSQMSMSKTESGRLADSLQILNGYFVSPEEKVLLIDRLEKLADKAGITYSLNNAIDGERVSLDMSVKGTFRNIYYFIKLLESNNYWVSFEKISLSRGTDKGAGTWSGSLVITIPKSDK